MQNCCRFSLNSPKCSEVIIKHNCCLLKKGLVLKQLWVHIVQICYFKWNWNGGRIVIHWSEQSRDLHLLQKLSRSVIQICFQTFTSYCRYHVQFQSHLVSVKEVLVDYGNSIISYVWKWLSNLAFLHIHYDIPMDLDKVVDVMLNFILTGWTWISPSLIYLLVSWLSIQRH